MKTIQKVWILGLIAALNITSLAAEKAEDKLDVKQIELAHYAKAFVGQGNITVEVAPYTSAGKPGAILLFKGVEGSWDGKAINHTVQPGSNGRVEYVTRYNGKNWTTLLTDKDEEGKMQYSLYLPGTQDAIHLAPSDGAAQLTTPQAILDEYKHQHGMKGGVK